ncbi:MAG: helix-turn-helix domain-containing protein [Thiogranum sp.]
MTESSTTPYIVSTSSHASDRLHIGGQSASSGPHPFASPAGCCKDCMSRDYCVGSQLSALSDSQPLPMLRHNHTLGYREHLFREGDAPEAIYVLKSGAVKLYLMSEDGGEQVVAFYMPGEVLGLDALGTDAHRSSATVLERASFCVISLASLDRIPGCHQLLYKLLSMELVRDHHTIELITKKDAEAKIANFLVDLSRRFRARGYSGSRFNLSMKRTEIGSYLGLAVETVSRILTRFQDEGLLQVQRRQIGIVDLAGLERLAGYDALHWHAQQPAKTGSVSLS